MRSASGSVALGVGRLLATLAAGLPPGSRILELGTGAGVVSPGSPPASRPRGRLGHHAQLDRELSAAVEASRWPSFVRFAEGDGAAAVLELGRFDLIFADAQGGKTEGLEGTLLALEPGGTLVVDDMDLALHDDGELVASLEVVRDRLNDDARLVVAELDYSSGVIVATRRRSAG